MSKKNLWMVRAGRGAKYIDDFLDGSFVGIGWTGFGQIAESTPKVDIEQRLKAEYPQAKDGSIAVWAAQIRRYFFEIQTGDGVTTYDPGRRFYFLGSIESTVTTAEHKSSHQRTVAWTHKVPRDSLSTGTRNSLGSISTLFLVPEEAAEEMHAKAITVDTEIGEEVRPAKPPEDVATEKDLMDEVVNKAREFIEDRVAQLSWEEMEELVAGILEAMGYRARLSTKGADRGVDIFASPDGLGLEEPRIFVEVKHRPATSIGAQALRAFLGGRQQGDRCLYVSTGGFTKDARYEAERSSVPVTLLSLPELRELLVEHYSKLETSVAAMVPLEKIYWPVA